MIISIDADKSFGQNLAHIYDKKLYRKSVQKELTLT